MLIALIPLSYATRNDWSNQRDLIETFSIIGSTTCCDKCPPNTEGQITPSQQPLTITCGVANGKALIDTYLIYKNDNDIRRYWFELPNPVTISGVNNPDVKTIGYECYVCNIAGDPGSGLDQCTSNQQCVDKARSAGNSDPSSFFCDSNNFCRQDCDAIWSGSCNNGIEQGTRPSGCNNPQTTRPCQNNIDPPSPLPPIPAIFTQFSFYNPIIIVLILLFLGLLLFKILRRKR